MGPKKSLQKRPGTLAGRAWLQGGGAPSRIRCFVKEWSLNKSAGQLIGLNIGESQAFLGDPAERRENAWWKRAVIYQVAVQSFQDSNGDGKGDLRGLISRIDYPSWLGVQAVWLTPIYRSPMRDFGYDIADFCSVDPRFGTLEDF